MSPRNLNKIKRIRGAPALSKSRHRQQNKKFHGYTPKTPQNRGRAVYRWLSIIGPWALALVAAYGIYHYFTRAKETRETGKEITTPSGLKYVDEVIGKGASPAPGRTVVVHYTGKLQDGTVFDSSDG
ncbi:MAG: FKBP-type peptidyl-prolyl cis-trans isomerase, partial [Blastocatellia bacterium]|nr:FKBP-type peptidyl-prolyl cis-trans isomerase [Blastocatellia bacterium]